MECPHHQNSKHSSIMISVHHYKLIKGKKPVLVLVSMYNHAVTLYVYDSPYWTQ